MRRTQGTFHRLGRWFVALLLISTALLQAPARADDHRPIEAIVQRWVADWNRHDATALAALLTPDVDFVLVSGVSLKGRDAFRTIHQAQFDGRYDRSVFRLEGVPSISLVEDHVGLVLWRWRITGVRDADGGPAPDYHGIFTWVLTDAGGWQIRAAQNTVDR